MTFLLLGAPALLAALAVLVWPSGRRAAPLPRRQERSGGRRRAPGRRPRLRALLAGRGGRPVVDEEVQLLDGLATALDAGLSTEHALRVVLGPVGSPDPGDPWSELTRAADEGQPLAPAWGRFARRSRSRTADAVARAWAVAAATGAPLAAAVRSSAHDARERHRLERAVEVATAGARATATVLGLLPLAGVGLAALLGVGPAALYGAPLAAASAGLGLGLLLVGHLTVRRMVRGVLKEVV